MRWYLMCYILRRKLEETKAVSSDSIEVVNYKGFIGTTTAVWLSMWHAASKVQIYTCNVYTF